MWKPALSTIVCLTLIAGCGGGTVTDTSGGPVVAAVEPASGGMTGGTRIVVRGEGLSNPTPGEYQVLVGGQPALDVTVVDDTEVELVTPPGPQGPADLTVVTLEGETTVPGAYQYFPPPTVTGITPSEGAREGGSPVTVTGSGFSSNGVSETVCLIGLKELDDVVVVDDTTLTGLTPSSWTEVPKDVIVENRNGTGLMHNGFTYVGPTPVVTSVTPSSGSRAGGDLLTIVGDHYTLSGGDLRVFLGTLEATAVTRIDDQTLTCISPPSPAPGFVDVRVENNNGGTPLANAFYYIPEPVPSSITPAQGPIDGGTSVTITGVSFLGGGAVTVLFDGAPATSVVVVDDTTITCDTPQGASTGAVDLVLQNANGQGTLPGAFTYLAPAFWWEQTFGTPSSSTGYTAVQSVSIPDGFPYFGTNQSSVYMVGQGHIDFGAYNNTYTQANTLFTHPHISVMGQINNPSTTYNLYSTSHVSGRTIITYDRVPEYSATGANSIQIHMHKTGFFAIVYKDVTFHAVTTYNATGMVAVNPGGGSPVSVDWSNSQSGAAGECMKEEFSSTSDLDDSMLVFEPNVSGGYDSTYVSGVPTDPNP